MCDVDLHISFSVNSRLLCVCMCVCVCVCVCVCGVCVCDTGSPVRRPATGEAPTAAEGEYENISLFRCISSPLFYKHTASLCMMLKVLCVCVCVCVCACPRARARMCLYFTTI